MTKPFALETGEIIPGPTTRAVHRYHGSGVDGGRLECWVIESRYSVPAGGENTGYSLLMHLHASSKDPKWEFVAGDYLGAVVQHWLNNGWSLVSMDRLGASLRQ